VNEESRPPRRLSNANSARKSSGNYGVRIADSSLRYEDSPRNAAAITERDLTSYVRDLAKTFGWRRYHTFFSVKSTPGFPDELLLRGPRLIVAELKSSTGRVSEAQSEWLEAWRQIPGAEVFTWTPEHMDEIAEVLR
jgi:hypothetical protein